MLHNYIKCMWFKQPCAKCLLNFVKYITNLFLRLCVMWNAEYFFGCQRNVALVVKMCQMCKMWIEPIMIDHERTVLTKDSLTTFLFTGFFFLKRISAVLMALLWFYDSHNVMQVSRYNSMFRLFRLTVFCREHSWKWLCKLWFQGFKH